MSSIRRKDREIPDINEIHEILRKAEVCRVALCDGDQPYCVPFNFGVEFNEPLVLYFHSAIEGRKLDIIRKNPKACFEVDIDKELVMGEKACSCSMTYRSVIGFGKLVIVNSFVEKIAGLKIIMSHYSESTEYQFDEKVLEKTLVLKFMVDTITGKKKIAKY